MFYWCVHVRLRSVGVYVWDGYRTIHTPLYFDCFVTCLNSAGGFRAEGDGKAQHVRVSHPRNQCFQEQKPVAFRIEDHRLYMRFLSVTRLTRLVSSCSSSCSLETSLILLRAGLPLRFHSNHRNPHPFGVTSASRKHPPPPPCFHGNGMICGPLPKDDQLLLLHPVMSSRAMTQG